jgi:cellobiose phosphorylase
MGINQAQTNGSDESPLRSELFSLDQMEQHGVILAGLHQLKLGRSQARLLTRLAANETRLFEIHNLLTGDVKEERRITPAADWLLDNYYLIEEQIQTARRHLPKGYIRELPRLLDGPSDGLPRVYDIALETISHGDGRADLESLGTFVSAYQSVTVLKLGELWAIPIMLRLALIENLRRVAVRIAADRINRNLAEFWADQMMDVATNDPKNLIMVIADMTQSTPPMVSSFVAELARRLQGHGPGLALPLTWIEQRLSESGLTIEHLVRAETQQQAADQVSMSNSIGSLRLLGSIDWRTFVEKNSAVERILCGESSGVYGGMDFATRDRYRHMVERLAKKSYCSESGVADHAVQLASEAASNNMTDRETHVGFYLIGEGVAQLRQRAGVHSSPLDVLYSFGRRHPLLIYVGSILLLTASFSLVFITKAMDEGLHGWILTAVGILIVLCSSHLSVALVNWITTFLTEPKPLPRMDFSKGIPAEHRTLVVVPTMLTGIQAIEELIESLEVRFLANRGANLHFGLLTDFRDAEEENCPEDQPLLHLVQKRINGLNEKYRGTENDTFFLFHRKRLWNPQDRIWMGYERKRGKLSDVNALIRGGSRDAFSHIIGRTDVLLNVRFIITLDTDTQLARDSAWQFVGTMAHPLNRAKFCDVRKRVVEGYGILQPRVAVSLPGANRSRYARMNASEPGIDPYTRTVSDVYQDLFGEGSFIGKGIYDVDVFEQALHGRFPENRILSHDLLEGCYARSGLMSDGQLYEEYPSRYSSDVCRRHRWIRGDWQIASWILPGIPGPDGRLIRNPLSFLSRWKIFDNLRRSLMATSLTLLFLAGWTILQNTWSWTLAITGVILIPPLITSTFNVLRKPVDVTFSQHGADSLSSVRRHFSQSMFTLVCLPYEGYFSLNAVFKTLWRMVVTHKLLLQWNPSSESEKSRDTGIAGSYRTMWFAPFIAMVVAIYLAVSHPLVLAAAGPILCLWFFSPAITWWISLPLGPSKETLSVDQTFFLRRLARKTWAFFETFISPEDNWLPPDNFQEHPVPVVAHRTSPTNMGLALLANLTAYDFGYITVGKLTERTSMAFKSMQALERYQGHFYNWYDTQSLKPLLPHYISSVDSGNLAGHLLTLRPGLLGLADHPILGKRLFEGLKDTLMVFSESSAGQPLSFDKNHLIKLEQDLEAAITSQSTTLMDFRIHLDQLAASAASALAHAESQVDDPSSPFRCWAATFAQQCQAALDEMTDLAPWAELLSYQNFPGIILLLNTIPTLRETETLGARLGAIIESDRNNASSPEEKDWFDKLQQLLATAGQNARSRILTLDGLVRQCDEFAQMDYSFLYDETRHLLTIGYNVSERKKDSGYYDLLASEARFASFIAIAQGQIPQENWFALGRLLTVAGGKPVLLSWSGSMFEYLMPLLVMPSFELSLLHQTCKTAVARQIEYGKKRSVPWGVSECGYNAIDVHLNYQYRAFGVPGLGLKRGLSDELVIAPYATMLALMVEPGKACQNLERLSEAGFETKYGFYEAIDYTPSRLPRGQTRTVVRSFMAHHQGMGLLSLAHLLLDQPMQKRFESEPLFQSTLLLLQERIPKATAFFEHLSDLSEYHISSSSMETPIRVFTNHDTPNPEVQLLSNGRYHVMVTNAGGGYSRWKDLSVTRWREDRTCDNWGNFCYIRDLDSKDFWSTSYQPVLKQGNHFEAIFSEGRAEFRCGHRNYDTHTEIAVSPEDDIELRRVRIVNRSRSSRSIDVTSYAEVVLAPQDSDALHPAFSNLFVQTEIVRRHHAILCHRRPRSQGENGPWMFHLMAVHGATAGNVSYETDRLRFIGRGNTVANPSALTGNGMLSDTDGSVLDPIVAIRYRITLGPEESVTMNMVTGIGETREAALNLVEKYQDRQLADRVFNLVWTHGQVLLRQFNASESDAQLFGRLAGSIIYANGSLRADPSVLFKNRRGQSSLWGYAISGDIPIVLLQIEYPENIELVRQMVQAHAYWRLKGLAVDLVIWNEDHAGYRQHLHDLIMGIISSGTDINLTDHSGGIFVRPGDQISEEDRILIQTVARIIITDSRGTIAEQIQGRSLGECAVPLLTPTRLRRPEPLPVLPMPRNDLIFNNGLGGFTPDGREYVITTGYGQLTPAPWVNVLANPDFGTVISESGLACTWSENAHEFRLTPWSNDPVSDSRGEAFYLRDDERAHFWSPTPLPCRGASSYVTRHGFGYSVFEHSERGIHSELLVYVAIDAPIKFSVLKIRNESGRPRRLSATGYAEWVLGDLRSRSTMHVVTEIDPNSGAVFARNPYNTEFSGRTAFFDVDDMNRTLTGDRTEFLGRNGTLEYPAAMTRTRLSGKVGAGLDPCAAIQVCFDLAPGQTHEIVFRLGIGRDINEAGKLVNRFRGSTAARGALDKVWKHWASTLGAVKVETPDPALNVMANGWLLYQTVVCRLWARAATYQSGGAFGFRDQLQDVMALVHTRPQMLRDHILLCAARQFSEGDVQHWWHPPTGRGVRTHCSDDRLWLPLATCRYVQATADTGILDEQIHFIQGRPVNPEEDSYYDLPIRSDDINTLYNHCVRAIKYSLTMGKHGLPLIGSGDWNDGMNLVGEHGQGESVWLGFFLYDVLTRFTDVARNHGDGGFAEQCALEAESLYHHIEQHGWDGEWYRRAYFDDGTPLGSSVNSECKIDSISQSWSVLSGVANHERAQTAMNSADHHLVRRQEGLIRLLEPPFDTSALNPGYIKGYVPGVRENGGQYTHAAIWATMAFARLGDNKRAWELFQIINPVNHGRTMEETSIYKVEPYVVAADVYAVQPHTGRGGWTWYTGSAAWMYRLIMESLLGLSRDREKLHINPCIPQAWEQFTVHYRYFETAYTIVVHQTSDGQTVPSLTVDGIEQNDLTLPLINDLIAHRVEVKIPVPVITESHSELQEA